jgi:glyoxylase-like metal-dependent hydrolase (beta-lactamase superfamily II)
LLTPVCCAAIRYIQQRHPVDFSTPADALARAGVKPEEVPDVVISHMNWDHAGGMISFLNLKPSLAAEVKNT